MMKDKIKQWVVLWLSFSLTILLVSISYAAFTTINSVNSWDTLTATKFNELVTRLNSIDKEQLATARVQFNWESCTGWAGNECTILASYNVSSVVRNSAWYYTLNFANAMDNTQYTWNITFWEQSATAAWRIWMFGGWVWKSIPYVHSTTSVNIISAYPQDNNPYDISRINVQVYGWKN